MFFQKLHDYYFGGLPCGDGLDPFCELISDGRDPSVLSQRMRIDLPDKIYSPLLKRGLDLDSL